MVRAMKSTKLLRIFAAHYCNFWRGERKVRENEIKILFSENEMWFLWFTWLWFVSFSSLRFDV